MRSRTFTKNILAIIYSQMKFWSLPIHSLSSQIPLEQSDEDVHSIKKPWKWYGAPWRHDLDICYELWKFLFSLPWPLALTFAPLTGNQTPNPIARTSSTKKIQPPFSIIFYLNEIHQSLRKIYQSYHRTEVLQHLEL